MKPNLFKIVLPAFALILAITASLAFTPSEKDVPVEPEITQGYYQVAPNDCPEVPVTVSCQETGCILCTVTIFGQVEQIYLDRNQAETRCYTVLFEWTC